MTFYGYRRPDGRVGVRNRVLILPASVCASDTARIIAQQGEGAILVYRDGQTYHIVRSVEKLPEDSEEFVRFWEKQYRGWELVECEKSFNEQTGWYFYLTMRRAHRKQNGGLK